MRQFWGAGLCRTSFKPAPQRVIRCDIIKQLGKGSQDIMRLDAISVRLWLYRGLVAVAAGLMVTAAIMPWWTADVEHDYYNPPEIQVYQWGIPSHPGSPSIVAKEITSLYLTVLAWIYIAASVGLILWSTWLKGRKGRLLLGGVGLMNIVYATVAIIWIAIRAGEVYGVPLQGVTAFAQELDFANVYTDVRLGYYLAHAAGLMCIVLALFRNQITRQA